MDGSYVAGSLFWLYAARHDPGEDLVRLAGPTLEAIGEATHETVNLSMARGERVVQVAQVDSQFLLGTRDWTQVDVPAHCSSLGKVFLAWDAVDLPPGPLGDTDQGEPRSRTRPRCAPTSSAPAAGAGPSPSTSSRSGSPVSPCRFAAPRDQVVAALGVSGPTQRLEDRFDELGRLLTHHAAALTELLRGKTPQEGAA